MTEYHILNGDCLAEQLRQTEIKPNYIICRECLIEGEVNSADLGHFWRLRSKFISETYKISTEEYVKTSLSEFEKINTMEEGAEVCLWFENDLFCQINMWFIISLLSLQPKLNIYRIFPVIKCEEDLWKGFGVSDTEMLERAYCSKIRFNNRDIELGKNLWYAYQKSNFNLLKTLSKTPSNCFEYLEEVCQAHIDRFPSDQSPGKLDVFIKELRLKHPTHFNEAFKEFSEIEGIYGFGDKQLSNVFDKLNQGYSNN